MPLINRSKNPKFTKVVKWNSQRGYEIVPKKGQARDNPPQVGTGTTAASGRVFKPQPTWKRIIKGEF